MRVDKKEIHAVVLDVLSKGYVDDPRPVYKREALVQAVGEEQFKLLELIPKTLEISLHERIYIGDLNRDKIERVKRRISFNDLTQTARVELIFAIEKMVSEREPEFVQFFNKAISKRRALFSDRPDQKIFTFSSNEYPGRICQEKISAGFYQASGGCIRIIGRDERVA